MERRACALLGLVCLIAVTMSRVEAQQQNKANDKLSVTEVSKILHNSRLLTGYIKCMLDKGACTADAREIKKTFPDAIKTGCENCSQNQKDIANTVISHLMQHRPNEWRQLIEKYDKTGEFQKRYEARGKKL